MGDFFRGWKRNVGCLTLLMACLLMAAWIRGRSVRTEMTLGMIEKGAEPKYTQRINMFGKAWFERNVMAKDYYQIILTDGIAFRRIKVTNPEWSLGLKVGIRETSDDAFRSLNEYVWRQQLFGIDAGELRDDLKFENVTIVGNTKESAARNNPQLRLTYLSMPYWSIILPLTLISAYLLLSKPRTSTQKNAVETRPAEGT